MQSFKNLYLVQKCCYEGGHMSFPQQRSEIKLSHQNIVNLKGWSEHSIASMKPPVCNGFTLFMHDSHPPMTHTQWISTVFEQGLQSHEWFKRIQKILAVRVFLSSCHFKLKRRCQSRLKHVKGDITSTPILIAQEHLRTV